MNIVQKQFKDALEFVDTNLCELALAIKECNTTGIYPSGKFFDLMHLCEFAGYHKQEVAIDLINDAALNYVVNHTKNKPYYIDEREVC